jgi:hypothetical protein
VSNRMGDYWLLILLAAYFVVMKWVLPKLGVPT